MRKRFLAILLLTPLLLAPRGGGNVQTPVNILPNCGATTGACPADYYFCLSSNVIYRCHNSAWTTITATALDLGLDGTLESTDVKRIETTGDTNSIFTEPSADYLKIDLSKNWPACDASTAATALAADPANCSAGSLAAGITAAGVAEGCADPILESELTNEATLETQLGSINVIVSTEIDTTSELETLQSGVNIILATEIDSEAELEAIEGDNIIVDTEIDTLAELNAIITDYPVDGYYGTSCPADGPGTSCTQSTYAPYSCTNGDELKWAFCNSLSNVQLTPDIATTPSSSELIGSADTYPYVSWEDTGTVKQVTIDIDKDGTDDVVIRKTTASGLVEIEQVAANADGSRGISLPVNSAAVPEPGAGKVTFGFLSTYLPYIRINGGSTIGFGSTSSSVYGPERWCNGTADTEDTGTECCAFWGMTCVMSIDPTDGSEQACAQDMTALGTATNHYYHALCK